MAEIKTQKNDQDVIAFLNAVENETRRKDSFKVLEIMQEATNDKPAMWGDSIIGFGKYIYKYASGRQGDWFQTGFSPRKQNLTLYIMPGFSRYENLLKKLGKHKHGKSCLYLNSLDDIDLNILTELIQESVNAMTKRENK